MTHSTPKPGAREWTIKLFEDTYNYYEDIQGPNTGETAHGIEAIRVIERTYADQLERELAECRAEIKRLKELQK